MTEGHLEFGFVERQLVADLRDIGRWKVRAEAMEQLHQRVVSLSSVGRLLPALPDFVAFLQTLLGSDQNTTIRLQTTYVVGDLVEKLGARLSLHVQPLAASMAENLGDSRDDLSEATVSVLLKVARASRPQKVIEALGPAVRQVDGHRRVEALRLVASALLVGEKTDFDYSSVIGLCVETWRHADSAVKDAAVETLALVHAQVGPVTFKLMDGGYSAAEARNQLHEHVAKKKGCCPVAPRRAPPHSPGSRTAAPRPPRAAKQAPRAGRGEPEPGGSTRGHSRPSCGGMRCGAWPKCRRLRTYRPRARAATPPTTNRTPAPAGARSTARGAASARAQGGGTAEDTAPRGGAPAQREGGQGRGGRGRGGQPGDGLP